MTRLLDLSAGALVGIRGPELIDAVRASEGRTVMAEVVAGAPSLVGGASNAELVCAFGADLVCLNLVDLTDTGVSVEGLEDLDPAPNGLAGLADLLGRPVGLNLEPDIPGVPASFRATEVNLRVAEETGAAFAMVTANPRRGASAESIATAVEAVRRSVPGLVCFAGKMHHAGQEERVGPDVARRIADAGAHGVLVPLPGTVPGLSEDVAAEMVSVVRSMGALALGTIGTSQEGSDRDTIRALALAGKRIGVDIHHIGDAGFEGVAHPENIYAYSVTIRGVRHTWSRMARGVRASWSGKEQ